MAIVRHDSVIALFCAIVIPPITAVFWYWGILWTYKLPANYNDAYHVCGDGVAVPVVRFLSQHLLEPLAWARQADMRRRKTGR